MNLDEMNAAELADFVKRDPKEIANEINLYENTAKLLQTYAMRRYYALLNRHDPQARQEHEARMEEIYEQLPIQARWR